ncbi:hypothetical protein AVEN_111698-1, partial [Araneus ventricosus]
PYSRRRHWRIAALPGTFSDDRTDGIRYSLDRHNRWDGQAPPSVITSTVVECVAPHEGEHCQGATKSIPHVGDIMYPRAVPKSGELCRREG